MSLVIRSFLILFFVKMLISSTVPAVEPGNPTNAVVEPVKPTIEVEEPIKVMEPLEQESLLSEPVDPTTAVLEPEYPNSPILEPVKQATPVLEHVFPTNPFVEPADPTTSVLEQEDLLPFEPVDHTTPVVEPLNHTAPVLEPVEQVTRVVELEDPTTKGSSCLKDAVQTGSCPSSWLDASHVGLGCLFYSWEEGRTAASYARAVSSCARGPHDEFCSSCGTGAGHLLEILTVEQHQYIIHLLDMMEYNNTVQFYTAATDMNREGEWYWSHSLVDVEDFVWQEGWPQYHQFSTFGTLNKPCPGILPGCEWTLRDVPENWNGGAGFYPFCQYQPSTAQSRNNLKLS